MDLSPEGPGEAMVMTTNLTFLAVLTCLGKVLSRVWTNFKQMNQISDFHNFHVLALLDLFAICFDGFLGKAVYPESCVKIKVSKESKIQVNRKQIINTNQLKTN